MMLGVDMRWKGNHGIARYSSEILRRIDLPWVPVASSEATSGWRALMARPAAPDDVDLIFSPGYMPLRTSKPQLLVLHDLIHLDFAHGLRRRRLQALYHGRIRPVIRSLGCVLTVSEYTARRLETWLGEEIRIEVVPNGLAEAFRPVAAAKSRPEYLLFVGNLRKRKNLPTVLEAVGQIPRDVRLICVTPDAPTVADLALACGVGERVDVLSDVDDETLAGLYRGAIATLVPSAVEGFGLPAIESLACGTTVLYWEGCEGLAEVTHGQGVPVEDLYDSRSWARAIRDVLDTPPEVDSDSVLKKYNWQRSAAKLTDLLGDLAGHAVAAPIEKARGR